MYFEDDDVVSLYFNFLYLMLPGRPELVGTYDVDLMMTLFALDGLLWVN